MTMVYHAAAGQSFRLGCNLSTAPRQMLQLRRYFTAPTTALPAECLYDKQAEAALKRMYNNDSLGCCVVSGAYHAVGVWSGNDSDSGGLIQVSDSEARQQYFECTGGRDIGLNIGEFLDFWRTRGIAVNGQRKKIDGAVAINIRDPLEVKTAIILFGGIKIGCSWLQSIADAEAQDAVIGPPHGRNYGGHDIEFIGYNATGVRVSSHGMTFWLTWDALQSGFIGESYVVLAPLWYGKDQLASACGVNFDQLKADLAKLDNGEVPPLPTPVEPPAPVPVPVPVPVPQPLTIWERLYQFVLWLESLLGGAHSAMTASAAGIDASTLPLWVQKILASLPVLLPIIIADLQAGKTWEQILADCIAALRAKGETADTVQGPFADKIKAIVMALIQNAPALIAIVTADLAQGKPWYLILIDVLAELHKQPALAA